jgi:hypothetical protein
MVCPEGLEPPTPSLEGWCSIQLSYGQMKQIILARKLVYHLTLLWLYCYTASTAASSRFLFGMNDAKYPTSSLAMFF